MLLVLGWYRCRKLSDAAFGPLVAFAAHIGWSVFSSMRGLRFGTFVVVTMLVGCGNDDSTHAHISNFCVSSVNGTPVTGCPTPTETPDNELHEACPVTPGETITVNGTPYVVLARACTATA